MQQSRGQRDRNGHESGPRSAVEVWRREGIEIGEHPYPEDAYASGCGWPVAFSFDVDPAWTSGFYEVSLHADGEVGEAAKSEAFFVVRPSAPSSADAIIVLATNTYNAYNEWGGKCLYSGAVKVSFDRPFERGYVRRPASPDEVAYDGRVASLPEEPDEEHTQLQQYLADFEYPLWCASGSWHNWERRFVQWAEGEGLTLDYAVNSDLELHPEVLDGQRLMLSVGHDEYWSWGMRDSADAFVESGGSWAILSGNTCFWQVRYEDDGRTMVAYKAKAESKDPVAGTDDHRRLTSMWSLPSIGRPEAETIGLSFSRGGYARVGKATPAKLRRLLDPSARASRFRGHRSAVRRRAGRTVADRRLRGRRLRTDDGQRRSRADVRRRHPGWSRGARHRTRSPDLDHRGPLRGSTGVVGRRLTARRSPSNGRLALRLRVAREHRPRSPTTTP